MELVKKFGIEQWISISREFISDANLESPIRKSGGGTVINTASLAVMGAATPQLAYTASKGGVLAMTRELAIIHAEKHPL